VARQTRPSPRATVGNRRPKCELVLW
jgi:hypothetical protein